MKTRLSRFGPAVVLPAAVERSCLGAAGNAGRHTPPPRSSFGPAEYFVLMIFAIACLGGMVERQAGEGR
ncbi:hypothetical protein SSTU70S_01552 [Stutzerimonas stutzeri]